VIGWVHGPYAPPTNCGIQFSGSSCIGRLRSNNPNPRLFCLEAPKKGGKGRRFPRCRRLKDIFVLRSILRKAKERTIMDYESDAIALAVLDQYRKLPAKRKPTVRDNGLHEWVPLSGIVVKGIVCNYGISVDSIHIKTSC